MANKESLMTKIKKTTPLALALLFALCPTVSMAQAPSPQACGGVMLDVCPTPFDPVLPATKDMLNWDRSARVIGFRNDYRN